jgi:hypothetical protein
MCGGRFVNLSQHCWEEILLTLKAPTLMSVIVREVRVVSIMRNVMKVNVRCSL